MCSAACRPASGILITTAPQNIIFALYSNVEKKNGLRKTNATLSMRFKYISLYTNIHHTHHSNAHKIAHIIYSDKEDTDYVWRSCAAVVVESLREEETKNEFTLGVNVLPDRMVTNHSSHARCSSRCDFCGFFFFICVYFYMPIRAADTVAALGGGGGGGGGEHALNHIMYAKKDEMQLVWSGF